MELVAELLSRNSNGQYDELINNAANGMYHDILKPSHVKEPKVLLIRHLKIHKDLGDIVVDVLNCEYDEEDQLRDEIAKRNAEFSVADDILDIDITTT